MERILALIILAPFVLLAVAALRFYLANPHVRPRTRQDYVRDTWALPPERQQQETDSDRTA